MNTMKRKILLHLPTPLIPIDTGAKRKQQGLLKYFRDRKDFFSVDAIAANGFGQNTWTIEQQEEALKSVENFFLYKGEHNLVDFVYSRTQSFYHRKLRQQQLPVDHSYDTPLGYINFIRSLAARQKYEFILIQYLVYARLALIPELDRSIRIMDVVDLASEISVAHKNLLHYKGLKFDFQSNLLREAKQLSKFDIVLITSQSEMETIKPYMLSDKLRLIPYPLQDLASQSSIPHYSNRKFVYDLIFVGNDFPPNVEGIQFFLESVLPNLLTKKPDLKMAIVGKVGNAIQLSPNTEHNVEVLGFVPDLLDIYLKTKLVICPLLSGSGTKIKVQEAMRYGVPLVTTTTGASGQSFKDGVNAFITDDPELFAQKVLYLIDNFELAQTFSKEIFLTHEREYSSSTFYKKFDDVFGVALPK